MVGFMIYTEEREHCFGEHCEREIYDFLRAQGIDHDEAANAADWCNLAAVGEEYESEYVHIMVEEV